MTKFTISRTFDAPQRTVFDYWVTPEHFVSWCGPEGCESKLLHADVRPGGHLFEWQKFRDDKFFLKHAYRKVQPYDELVFVISFCTEDGEHTQHPFLPDWPEYLLTTVKFEDLGSQTRVTVEWDPIDVSDVQLAYFNEHQHFGQEGWKQGFDKLERLLGVMA